MTVPKGLMEWLNTKAGNTISMFLAGAFVVLLATGKIHLPWTNDAEQQAFGKDQIQALLREELQPMKDDQKEQAKKIEAIGLELANLKGRMQLAGLTSNLSGMGAGRRN